MFVVDSCHNSCHNSCHYSCQLVSTLFQRNALRERDDEHELAVERVSHEHSARMAQALQTSEEEHAQTILTIRYDQPRCFVYRLNRLNRLNRLIEGVLLFYFCFRFVFALFALCLRFVSASFSGRTRHGPKRPVWSTRRRWRIWHGNNGTKKPRHN